MAKKQLPKMALLGRVWVPIIVALIGAAATIIAVLVRDGDIVTKPSTDMSFTYPVRVEVRDTGKAIPNAEVRIEVGGQAPLDDITDTNGFVRIVIPSSHEGQRGKLIVVAKGYKRYTQEIDLKKDLLPDVILLDPAP